MNRISTRILAGLAAALLLPACASTKIPRASVAGSSPEAQSLMTAAQRAHGGQMYATIRDLNAKTANRWTWLGSRLQSGVTDSRYRKESEEAIDLVANTTVQLSKGRGGRKFVARGADRVAVWYNGQAEENEKVKRAAAVTADLSRMFLLGPLFFERMGVTVSTLGTSKVDRAVCDDVLAVVRPGFGFSDEDRVVLSIDRTTNRVRRMRTTMNGLGTGDETECEVTFREWAQKGGVWWPAEFDERMKVKTRHWLLLDLKLNHGVAPRAPEMVGELIGEAARGGQ